MAASLAFHDLPYTELLGAPKGRRRTAQGVSPGNTNSNNVSPERAKQLVSVLKSNSVSPFQGSASCTLNPGLTPWAVLMDPFGVPIQFRDCPHLRASRSAPDRKESHFS